MSKDLFLVLLTLGQQDWYHLDVEIRDNQQGRIAVDVVVLDCSKSHSSVERVYSTTWSGKATYLQIPWDIIHCAYLWNNVLTELVYDTLESWEKSSEIHQSGRLCNYFAHWDGSKHLLWEFGITCGRVTLPYEIERSLGISEITWGIASFHHTGGFPKRDNRRCGSITGVFVLARVSRH